MRKIRQATLMRCFLRSYLVAGAYNNRGLQNVGFVHAMDPGLRDLYPKQADLQEARGRYLRHYNCHPFWAPLLLGVFLHTETVIAAGRMHSTAFLSFKDTTANTLSALGDSFFGGTMLAGWALLGACLLAMDQPWAFAALTLVLFAGLQLFKLCTYVAGLRYGFSILLGLRRWDLINWADRLKLLNAGFLLAFLCLLFPPDHAPLWWLAMAGGLGVAAWVVGRVHLSRIVLALGALAAVFLLRIFAE